MSCLVPVVDQDALTIVGDQPEPEWRFHYATLRIGIAHRSRRVALDRQQTALRQRIFSQCHVGVHRGVDRFLQRRTARSVGIDDPGRLIARERLASHGDYAECGCDNAAHDYCGLRMMRFEANGDLRTTPSTESSGSQGLPN